MIHVDVCVSIPYTGNGVSFTALPCFLFRDLNPGIPGFQRSRYCGLQTHLLYTFSATQPAVTLHSPTPLNQLYLTHPSSRPFPPGSTGASNTQQRRPPSKLNPLSKIPHPLLLTPRHRIGVPARLPGTPQHSPRPLINQRPHLIRTPVLPPRHAPTHTQRLIPSQRLRKTTTNLPPMRPHAIQRMRTHRRPPHTRTHHRNPARSQIGRSRDRRSSRDRRGEGFVAGEGGGCGAVAGVGGELARGRGAEGGEVLVHASGVCDGFFADPTLSVGWSVLGSGRWEGRGREGVLLGVEAGELDFFSAEVGGSALGCG